MRAPCWQVIIPVPARKQQKSRTIPQNDCTGLVEKEKEKSYIAFIRMFLTMYWTTRQVGNFLVLLDRCLGDSSKVLISKPSHSFLSFITACVERGTK
jgi:hypothetical protein